MHQLFDGLKQHEEGNCDSADAGEPLNDGGIAIVLRDPVRCENEEGKRERENAPCVSGGCLHWWSWGSALDSKAAIATGEIPAPDGRHNSRTSGAGVCSVLSCVKGVVRGREASAGGISSDSGI